MCHRALAVTYIEMDWSDRNTLRRKQITDIIDFTRRQVTVVGKACFLRSNGPQLQFHFCLMLDGCPQATDLTSHSAFWSIMWDYCRPYWADVMTKGEK